ncbi:hypothetical protein GCM10022393_41480 [Aquimarina addita]|uniref:Uncharacterized protein n=1 Tax=Aquimarina addita TaxID=870485 RepID=A0ABP6UVR3_9FLAO
MGYTVYIFRKEVKDQYASNFDFLEHEDQVMSFTKEQHETLKTRLLAYGYQIESDVNGLITFNFNGGEFGIQTLLTEKQLSFSSGFSDDGLAEILMTSSELTDSGEFAKLDLQDGKWEEI